MEVLKAESGSDSSLKRTLSRTNLIALGIGAVIGAGIFVLTGQAAAQYAGPGVAISFVVSAMACAFAGLCYAEFAAMIPIAGSAYTYAYATMGRIVAWIIGWALILEYLFSGATVAVGWSGYVVNFMESTLGITIPSAFSSAPIVFDANNNMSFTGSIINLPAMLIVLHYYCSSLSWYKGISQLQQFCGVA